MAGVDEPAILAERTLPFGRAEVVEWNWRAPLDVTVRADRHMIEMALPPHATDGVAAFPALDPDRYRFMGTLFLRPASIDIHARSAGGQIRVVRVAVDPDAGGVARDLALTGDRIADGLDLRAARPRLLLGLIRDELLRPGAQSDTLVRAYADALLIETARAITARRAASRSAARLADWQHARVAARIAAPGPVPDVAELAGLCGISARHFTRLYRALAGESAATTIERARLRRAMVLLDEGVLPVKAVAAAAGYARATSFAVAFQRATGAAPTAWRQRRRGVQ